MRLHYKISVIVIVLLALLVAGPALIPVDKFRLQMEQSATRSIGMPVVISSLSLRLLPAPGFKITGITIHHKQEKEVRAAARSGQVDVAILPLLSGHLQATTVFLKNIVIFMQEETEGSPQRTLRLDSISGHLLKDGGGLSLPAWRVGLYHGVMLVDARIVALDNGQPAFTGKVHISDVHLLPLLKDIAGEPRLSAALDADLHFSISGRERPGLNQQFILDGPVHLHDGSLYGVSLSGSMMNWLTHRKEDGGIPFEKLDFKLLAHEGYVQFREIQLKANNLAARGRLDIDPQRAIKGMVMASGLGGLVSVDLLLAGTVENPLISLAPPPSGSES